MTALDEMTPSVELLRALIAADASHPVGEDVLPVVAGYERMISWLTACQNDLLADAYRAHDTDPASEPRWFSEQVGLALGVAGASAHHRMRQAVILVEALPHVTAALRDGVITVHHARLAAAQARVLDVQTAQAVDKVVMTDDSWRTPGQLERALAKTILDLDPEGSAIRHEARRRERDVTARPEPDGMISLWALLPAEQGQAVIQEIDAHARSSSATRAPGDDRTLAQRRADALCNLILRDPGSGEQPTTHGRRPQICVTVALSTLLGADHAPADLTGYGWITADTARRVAADPSSVWRRLIVDPVDGRLLDYGRTTYRPPQDLADHVIARDRRCVFPTCDHPATTCDLDHHHDWLAGGPTNPDNTHPLCRRHHRLKHDGGWTYDIDPDDHTTIWTDPTGTQHEKPAATLPVPSPVERAETGPPPF